MMMEGAGFEVIDLGINNPVEKYLDAIEEHQPDILGMSALLTTTMPYMKVVIDTMKEKGMRDDYIVLVGGAPLNEEFAKADRRRCLLPRRGGGRRDRQGLHGAQAQRAKRVIAAGLCPGSIRGMRILRKAGFNRYVLNGALCSVDRVGCVAADATDRIGTGAQKVH